MELYRPRGTIRDYWACEAREVLVEGPVRTGKSAGICEKDQRLCLRHPGLRVLWLRQYRASLTQSIMQLFDDHLAAWGEIMNRTASRSHRDSYRFANGSEIVCGGLDNAERIMGSEYDRISIFEATEVDEDSYCGSRGVITRLSGEAGPYNQITCDCNPQGPTHWLNMRAMAGHMARFSVGFKCNPRWWSEDDNDWTDAGRDYVHGTLGRLQGVARARLYEGRWVQSEGVVYDIFDRTRHVCETDAPPKSVIIGVDDGYTDPFAALRIELDPDRRAHVAREVYSPGMTITDKIAAVRELGGESATIIYDAAAAQLGAELRQHFRDVQACDKTVSIVDGIGLVRERLTPAGDGLPRLTVDPGCASTLREIDLYEWKRRRDGTGKDDPVDQWNHALDALRYAIVHLDRMPAMKIAAVTRAGKGRYDDERMWSMA
jgi:phage terminase large subunit